MKIGDKVKVVFGKIEIPCTIVNINKLSVDIQRDDNKTIWNFETEYIKEINNERINQ